MKSVLLLSLGLLFLLIAHDGNAQNMVPNPSFEDYTQCPTGISSIGRPGQATIPTHW